MLTKALTFVNTKVGQLVDKVIRVERCEGVVRPNRPHVPVTSSQALILKSFELVRSVGGTATVIDTSSDDFRMLVRSGLIKPHADGFRLTGREWIVVGGVGPQQRALQPA